MIEDDWALAKEACIHCGLSDFTSYFGARAFVLCACCQAQGTHKECEEKAEKIILSEESLSSLQWHCSEVHFISFVPANI